MNTQNGKVWIYQSDRKLSEQEVLEIQNKAQNFVEKWAAHGAQLKASAEVLFNHFLVLKVDESQAMASGCSIDSSVAFVKQIGKEYNIDFFNRLNLAFLNNDNEVELVAMANISEKVNQGIINENTFVFNNLVTLLSDFDKKWKIPMKASWAAKYLNITMA